jgi:hypothetical protein
MMPSGVNATVKGGFLELADNGAKLRVPKSVIDEWKERFGFWIYSEGNHSTSKWSPPRCLFEFGQKRSYAAVRSEVAGLRGAVYCLDARTGDKIWQVSLWGCGGFHDAAEVDMQVADKILIVFGRSNQGVCAEAFEVESGRCVFRFASKLWSVIERR